MCLGRHMRSRWYRHSIWRQGICHMGAQCCNVVRPFISLPRLAHPIRLRQTPMNLIGQLWSSSTSAPLKPFIYIGNQGDRHWHESSPVERPLLHHMKNGLYGLAPVLQRVARSQSLVHDRSRPGATVRVKKLGVQRSLKHVFLCIRTTRKHK